MKQDIPTPQDALFLTEAFGRYYPMARFIYTMFQITQKILLNYQKPENFINTQFTIGNDIYSPAYALQLADQLARCYVTEIENYWKKNYFLDFMPLSIPDATTEPLLLDGPQQIMANITRQLGEDWQAAQQAHIMQQLQTFTHYPIETYQNEI
ncbi:hypothetical protein GA0116948_11076 [Chitinophaga costaii]|uniref:Uncharacterized protein n=1 Tax=Chitinophaga costaii TaxID=1335309 RepID=A0A1C4EWL4_9BACT|nr:hypothetical protein [Chitinophaga costaii]PUZ21584.1 hypothetical protein DCM91_16240 [Chitinophaga costaii]SCC48099.1 hypothetical protein GA0116948_11076 [Chitinophaga costaii]